jgi:hypothetical protein
MTAQAADHQPGAGRPRAVPSRLAHVVLRIRRFEPMTTWWATVLNADIAFKRIRPHWAVNYGPALSLYYRDPDGNQAELQIDRFTTSQQATAFLTSRAFASHPIGHSADFEDLARGSTPAKTRQH